MPAMTQVIIAFCDSGSLKFLNADGAKLKCIYVKKINIEKQAKVKRKIYFKNYTMEHL